LRGEEDQVQPLDDDQHSSRVSCMPWLQGRQHRHDSSRKDGTRDTTMLVLIGSCGAIESECIVDVQRSVRPVWYCKHGE
jgi:hypothetical protein